MNDGIKHCQNWYYKMVHSLEMYKMMVQKQFFLESVFLPFLWLAPFCQNEVDVI
jgi:hypothetical protein